MSVSQSSTDLSIDFSGLPAATVEAQLQRSCASG